MSFPTRRRNKKNAADSSAISARAFLLDRNFFIISAETGEENDDFGFSFFDLYPANRFLREEIEAYVTSYPRDVFLTLCMRTPVLFVGTLFAQTGLILAILPDGEIKKTLSLPAAFHRVPEHVCVSVFAKMHYKAHNEADFSAACRWLVTVSAPFVCHGRADTAPVASTLGFYAERLSELLGVPFSCDFSGMSALSCEGICSEFAVGVMLDTLMAARRAASHTGVRLYAAMESAPTLYLAYSRADLADNLPEFYPLIRVAAARGAVLDVVTPRDDPYLIQVRACIGVSELSAQGVRERHAFLEGKSPLFTLPTAYAISPSFPEFPVD